MASASKVDEMQGQAEESASLVKCECTMENFQESACGDNACGTPVLITGRFGTGKSTLVQKVNEGLTPLVHVACTEGHAHLGKTLHTYFAWIKNYYTPLHKAELTDNDLKRADGNLKYHTIFEHIILKNKAVLLVDTIGMRPGQMSKTRILTGVLDDNHCSHESSLCGERKSGKVMFVAGNVDLINGDLGILSSMPVLLDKNLTMLLKWALENPLFYTQEEISGHSNDITHRDFNNEVPKIRDREAIIIDFDTSNLLQKYTAKATYMYRGKWPTDNIVFSFGVLCIESFYTTARNRFSKISILKIKNSKFKKLSVHSTEQYFPAMYQQNDISWVPPGSLHGIWTHLIKTFLPRETEKQLLSEENHGASDLASDKYQSCINITLDLPLEISSVHTPPLLSLQLVLQTSFTLPQALLSLSSSLEISPTMSSHQIYFLSHHIAPLPLYFVTVSLLSVVSVFYLCILLLLSGDIETNPGPINSSEKANFGDLVTIPDVDSKWEALGIVLGLDRNTLAKISSKQKGNLKRKREMFRLTVKGGVTWRDVIKALCDVGLPTSARSVCETYDIVPNGLSSYISRSEQGDSVEADCATPTSEVKSSASSVEFQTFQSTRSALVSEVTLDPIMLSNAVFSRGIITQGDLHELRVISPDRKKAMRLVSLIEETLRSHAFKFESFISALRSISTHVVLADKISQLYHFNRVASKMKNTEADRLDMNYLSAELNNSQLISDNCRIKAAGAANFVDMCSVLFADLQVKALGDAYLSLLDSFPNTKEVCATLREFYRPAESRPVRKMTEQEVTPKSSSRDIKRAGVGVEQGHMEKSPLPKSSSSSSLQENRGTSGALSFRSNVTPRSLPDSDFHSGSPKSPVAISSYTGTARVLSPDTESDSYMSADSTRMSAQHWDDSYSEFHSIETAPPPFSSSELALQHSTNILGGAKETQGMGVVNVAASRKSGDSGFSTLLPATQIPIISPLGDGTFSNAQTLPSSKSDSLKAGSADSVAFTSSSASNGTPQAGLPSQTGNGGLNGGPRNKNGEKAKVRKPKPKLQNKLQHSKFQAALKRWDITEVDTLLSDGAADVEHIFEPDQQTALMLASIEGNKDMVRTLLQHGASVVARDQEGCTALYLAASNGNYEAVKILAQQPLADVNIKNTAGEPLIMDPVRKGFSMVTELLVQNGAKVNVESTDGTTPLYMGVKKGNYDVVKVLLTGNAEFTKQDKKTRRTPLEEAIQGDEPEIVRLLMKAVSRVNEKSQKLFTCKTRDQVKSLIDKGAKVNTRNSDEATPLLVHAQQGNTEIVRELIQQRANVDLQDCHGYSALNVAAKKGNLELVQLLVKNGAILDLKESTNGYTSLMFAIEKGHVRIARELVLAKANVNIRNRDNKSSLDLARELGDPQGMMEVLNMQPTTSATNDPFISMLSGYMLDKGRAKRNSPKSSAKGSTTPPTSRSRASSTLKTSYVPEEDSAHVAEVKKYQKRIADLETRIHDLTILGTMDIADESDLTYMERGRLETEFRKLKESKKKAEQYAVEAKQTAQRLSAENFKLREDLSKERHFNELTRKNMMREVELSVERDKGHAKTKDVRMEVFDEEVAKKAFLGRESSSLYQRVEFTGTRIKEVIMEQSVHLDMYHLVVGGLPYSGKTTLVNSIFDIPQKPEENAFDIYLHEAVIHRNKLSGNHDWYESSKLQANVHTIIAALAYFFAKEHQLPILNLKDALQFDDPEIQSYFETTCECLQSLVQKIDSETVVEKMLSGSLSLVNVFDVGVNRAVYEFMMAVGGRNKNLLLVNVLDLTRSDKETITKPLNLEDPRYGGKYSKTQASLFGDRTALRYLASFTEAASHAKPSGSQPAVNTVIVGTHADKFQSKSELIEREKEVRGLLNKYDDDMGYGSKASPELVTVDASDKEDCKHVRDHLLKLVDHSKGFGVNRSKGFSVDLPVRFIFLRCVLFSTKKVHMPRKEVIEYARKCGIKDESEVDDFLEIFRNCASIISSEDKKEFLYSYVILIPIDFLRGLNKLYCIQDEQTIPSELKEPMKYGILSVRVLRALWQGSDESMLTWEFYVQVLKNVLLLTDLGSEKFFCPSLRLEHSDVPLRPSSLVISSSASFTSFSNMQCAFVDYLTANRKHLRLDEECSYYNCIGFLSKFADEEGKVSIRFFQDFIEVFVDPSNISSNHAANLYSMLKTDCVAIMNTHDRSAYKLCVVCPKSSLDPTDAHFVPFDILNASPSNMRCTMCRSEVTEVKGIHWVKAAFQGSRRAALKAGDMINPVNLLQICKEELSSLTIQEIKKLSEKLEVADEFAPTSHSPVDEILFHILYSWHHKNPTATKRKLALLLKESGLFKQAVKLNPQLLGHDDSTTSLKQGTTFSSKEITILASSWTEEPEELATVLGVQMVFPDDEEEATDTDKCSSILQQWLLGQSEGDKREMLVDKLERAEYHSMAAVIAELPN